MEARTTPSTGTAGPPSAWQHGTEQAARKKGFLLHSSHGRGSGRNTLPVPKRRKHSSIATPQKGGRHSPNVRPIRSALERSSGWPTRPHRAGGRSTTRGKMTGKEVVMQDSKADPLRNQPPYLN